MTAAGVTLYRVPALVERRWSRRPGGIEIQTWRLVETRMLPRESAHLPLAVLFDDDGEAGAVPACPVDQPDTLEPPPPEGMTRDTAVPGPREESGATAEAEHKAERP